MFYIDIIVILFGFEPSETIMTKNTSSSNKTCVWSFYFQICIYTYMRFNDVYEQLCVRVKREKLKTTKQKEKK